MASIERDAAQRDHRLIVELTRSRFETLTPREREVLAHVTRGRPNKQIAFDFGISEVTVKLHRSNVIRKMPPRPSAS